MPTIDPPFRLDPFQNVVNVNWSGYYIRFTLSWADNVGASDPTQSVHGPFVQFGHTIIDSGPPSNIITTTAFIEESDPGQMSTLNAAVTTQTILGELPNGMTKKYDKIITTPFTGGGVYEAYAGGVVPVTIGGGAQGEPGTFNNNPQTSPPPSPDITYNSIAYDADPQVEGKTYVKTIFVSGSIPTEEIPADEEDEEDDEEEREPIIIKFQITGVGTPEPGGGGPAYHPVLIQWTVFPRTELLPNDPNFIFANLRPLWTSSVNVTKNCTMPIALQKRKYRIVSPEEEEEEEEEFPLRIPMVWPAFEGSLLDVDGNETTWDVGAFALGSKEGDKHTGTAPDMWHDLPFDGEPPPLLTEVEFDDIDWQTWPALIEEED